ncbi:hypothetical protein DM47_3140 [Burkholderia mallei]|nr:hypothetical protein DM47_3140 [Burkholderia mallei]
MVGRSAADRGADASRPASCGLAARPPRSAHDGEFAMLGLDRRRVDRLQAPCALRVLAAEDCVAVLFVFGQAPYVRERQPLQPAQRFAAVGRAQRNRAFDVLHLAPRRQIDALMRFAGPQLLVGVEPQDRELLRRSIAAIDSNGEAHASSPFEG